MYSDLNQPGVWETTHQRDYIRPVVATRRVSPTANFWYQPESRVWETTHQRDYIQPVVATRRVSNRPNANFWYETDRVWETTQQRDYIRPATRRVSPRYENDRAWETTRQRDYKPSAANSRQPGIIRAPVQTPIRSARLVRRGV